MAIRSEIGGHERMGKLIHAEEVGSGKNSVRLLKLWQSFHIEVEIVHFRVFLSH